MKNLKSYLCRENSGGDSGGTSSDGVYQVNLSEP